MTEWLTVILLFVIALLLVWNLNTINEHLSLFRSEFHRLHTLLYEHKLNERDKYSSIEHLVDSKLSNIDKRVLAELNTNNEKILNALLVLHNIDIALFNISSDVRSINHS